MYILFWEPHCIIASIFYNFKHESKINSKKGYVQRKIYEGLFLELVLINWFIYFWKAYHKNFPKKLFFMLNSYSLSRYRVLNMLIPKNGHFTVKHPKISLKWSKINIFLSFFFLKLSELHYKHDYRKKTEVWTHFGHFLSRFYPKMTPFLWT